MKKLFEIKKNQNTTEIAISGIASFGIIVLFIAGIVSLFV